MDKAKLIHALKLVMQVLVDGAKDDPPRDYFICHILRRLEMDGQIPAWVYRELVDTIEAELAPTQCLEAWASRTDPTNLLYTYADIPMAHLIHQMRICWVDKMIEDLEQKCVELGIELT